MQCDESFTIYPPSAAKLGSHIPARGLLSLAYNDTLWSLRLPRLTRRYPKPQSRVGMLGTVDMVTLCGLSVPARRTPGYRQRAVSRPNCKRLIGLAAECSGSSSLKLGTTPKDQDTALPERLEGTQMHTRYAKLQVQRGLPDRTQDLGELSLSLVPITRPEPPNRRPEHP